MPYKLIKIVSAANTILFINAYVLLNQVYKTRFLDIVNMNISEKLINTISLLNPNKKRLFPWKVIAFLNRLSDQ